MHLANRYRRADETKTPKCMTRKNTPLWTVDLLNSYVNLAIDELESPKKIELGSEIIKSKT